MSGVIPSEKAFERIASAVKRVEALPSGGESGPATGAALPPGAQRVVLLQDLENGFSAWSQLTRFVDFPWLDVAIFGDAADAEIQFTLAVDGIETEPIKPNATAGEMAAALTATGANVRGVGLGYGCNPETGALAEGVVYQPLAGLGTPAISGQAYNPGRWVLDLADMTTGLTVGSQSNGIDVAIRATNWIDAGSSERVYTAIPLSEPTPLTAGTVCIVQRVGGVLCVIGAEARYFEGLPRS